MLGANDIDDIGKLFLSPQGKKVLAVLRREFYDTVSFDPENSRMTDFNEGHRDLIQFITRITVKVKEDRENV